jgi:hypothetical protein
MESKAITTNRLGGVPSSATMFSVRVRNFPPNWLLACIALGSRVTKVPGSLISAMSITA